MIKAVVDIGTNSIKLLVGDNKSRWLSVITDDVVITKLGDELETTGAIGSSAFSRTLDGVAELVSRAMQSGASELRIIGTACLRRATNAAEFCSAVFERTGQEVEIISGEEEARLGTSAGLTLAAGHHHAVLFDIGGGSCEVAIVQDGRTVVSASLPLGALTMLRHIGEPTRSIQEALYIIEENIKSSIKKYFPVIESVHDRFAVVSGGSIATVASVSIGRDGGQSELHGYVLTMNELNRQIACYSSSDLNDVSKIPGMTQGREQTVLTGAIILKVLMRCWSVQEVTLSTMGLRYGALSEMLGI